MRPRLRTLSALALVAALAPSSASAFAPTGHATPDLELAPGAFGHAGGQALDARLRAGARFGAPPASLARAFKLFQADLGGGWRGTFDASLAAPSRLVGPGVHVPGSIRDAKRAEVFARTLLERHVALLAPGAAASDFVLVANDLDHGIRSVGFAQHHRGVRVRGGQVSFRFQADRLYVIGTEAVPHVTADVGRPRASDALLEAGARAWIEGELGVSAQADAPGEARVVALRTPRGRADALAVPVEVATQSPVSRHRVWVDATSGQALAREPLLHFAGATVLLRVPERAPEYGDRYDAPASLATANVSDVGVTTSEAGLVSWDAGAEASVELFLQSPRARVYNDVGDEASLEVTLADGGFHIWTAADEQLVDAQLTTFVHAGIAREYARGIAPTLGFFSQQVKATVNIDEVCNAFSDGTTINFYQAGQGCENTGRLADVVYHEYGHSLHNHAIIEGVGAFEGALSEGISDYFAATITGDPAMGRGFFGGADELRHVDPAGEEARWPEDVNGQVHHDGLIIGQTLWDLRKELVAAHGEDEGVAQADQLFYQGIRRAVDIPSMYVEVLAADDDDGDLTNGTPNACLINSAFGQHGLRAQSAEVTTPGLVPAGPEGLDVRVQLTGLFGECPEDALESATLTWSVRGVPSAQGELAMNVSDTELLATIPPQAEGSVVEYTVVAEFANAAPLVLPDNPADPAYQVFVGTTEPIYCTDFETDPALDGWTHDLRSGEDIEGADDWAWGPPRGTATNGDPPEAFSGERAFGNDLSVESNYNGLYQSDRVNFARSPEIDTSGYGRVRLQYRRWLNVEDAYFDRATIYANGASVWQNLDSQQGDDSRTHHRDREWRFHDVDVTENVSADGKLAIEFEIASDGGLEFGGWTIDDVCIVGVPTDGPCPDGQCGEGGGGEGGGSVDALDDPLYPQGGCGCAVPTRGGSAPAGLVALALGAAVVARRRLRRAG